MVAGIWVHHYIWLYNLLTISEDRHVEHMREGISYVFAHQINFVCLPDLASLCTSSSKTPFPVSANADSSLCALHSCLTQPITSWPVMGDMARFCLNSSLALHLLPWHLPQTQSVNTRKPSEAEDKQRSQSPPVRPTHTLTL